MPNLLLFLFFSLTPLICLAQKESNIWYFGMKGGIDFKSGAPEALKDGVINTGEGCATISDREGKLLFYTDGVTVWNRLHKPMPNGNGLMGHYSSTQSALIVPVPEDPNVYLIFTTDAAENKLQNGLRYSIVDVRLDNGFGNVKGKNILLLNPATEKLTAVKHPNKRDIWVIAHEWNSNAFYSYLVTPTGIGPNPVISRAGEAQGGAFDVYGLDNSRGQMKVSPKGNKLALAHRVRNRFEVYDFNNATGVISNPVVSQSIYANVYGVEFSPDGSKLYCSKYGYTAEIFQFDLNAGSPSAIINSVKHIATSVHRLVGALQLGPDGKIYVAKENGPSDDAAGEYLGVINEPNNAGLDCKYVDNGFFLGGKRSFLGLPNFVQSFLIAPDYDFAFESTCFREKTNFTINSIARYDSVKWEFGDVASGALNFSLNKAPFHEFTTTGLFKVKLTVYLGGVAFSLEKSVTILPLPTVDLGEDKMMCEGEHLVLNAFGSGLSYLWQNGSTAATFTVSSPGLYWVEVSNGKCKALDSIRVNETSLPPINLGNDTTLCFGQTITLSAGLGLSFKWQDGAGEAEYLVSSPGNYWVEVRNNECVATGTIRVEMEECISFIPNIITPNGDGFNETFYIEGIKPENWTLEIYNRWGKFVYKAYSYDNNWNADGLSDGTYYYLLTSKVTSQKHKGWVEVNR